MLKPKDMSEARRFICQLESLVTKKSKRIAKLELEVSQSNEILAEHDLINYKIINNQSERITELKRKLKIARSFIPIKDVVKYSMKLDKLKDGGV